MQSWKAPVVVMPRARTQRKMRDIMVVVRRAARQNKRGGGGEGLVIAAIAGVAVRYVAAIAGATGLRVLGDHYTRDPAPLEGVRK